MTRATSFPVAVADRGIDFPEVEGRRPTTPALKSILAAAADPVDPDLARRVRSTRNWRQDYVGLVREITAVSATSTPAALQIATAGLHAAYQNLVVTGAEEDVALTDLRVADAGNPYGTQVIHGVGQRVRELEVPYRGRLLSGGALRTQLDRWVSAGVVEPSFAAAIDRVVDAPELLAAPGRRIVLLGAGGEMSPLAPLASWGADVIALDLPRPEVSTRLRSIIRQGAGRAVLPTDGAGRTGVDLIGAAPEVAAWLRDQYDGAPLTIGMYGYANSGAHVRLTLAADLVQQSLLQRLPGTSVAYLATPTDAFAVPTEIVDAALTAHARRRPLSRIVQSPMRAASAGALFRPAYQRTGATDAAVADAIVGRQGPNYIMAKRLQRWRGVVAENAGHRVSFNVAPASWTRSVTQNRALAAAYRGASAFNIEVFEPDTCRVLMAALLVHDLFEERPTRRHPDDLFSDAAAHGGLWRAAFEPRSALGVAALAGALVPNRTRT